MLLRLEVLKQEVLEPLASKNNKAPARGGGFII
jgi:hypothetical protein